MSNLEAEEKSQNQKKADEAVFNYSEQVAEMYKKNSKFVQDKPINVVNSHHLRDPKSSQEIETIVGGQLKRMYE